MSGDVHLRAAARVGLAGVGSVVGVLLLDSAWGTVPGALLGLLVSFAGEWALAHRAEFRRLQGVERDMDRQIQMRELAEEQARLSTRRAAVAEAWTEVFGGVTSEAVSTGRIVPLAAILARAEVTMKARGLEAPSPTPATWPGNPPFTGSV